MFKKFTVAVIAIIAGSCVFAQNNYNQTFVGFNNIIKKQNLDVINHIQSIAENADVKFTKLWPNEYFIDNTASSYIYYAKNDAESLDIIKFDVFTQKSCDVSNFWECVPKIIPNIASYRYNERLIADYTPNFIDKPEEHTTVEIIEKENKYLGTIKISSNVNNDTENTEKSCTKPESSVARICTARDENTGSILYTEELLLKNPKLGANFDNFLKYIKYDVYGKKLEEYNYSHGKHTIYNQKGEIKEQLQWNEDKFVYMNSKLPDLYIDLTIIRDSNGRPIEEIYSDRNKKAVRKYKAEYYDNKITKIYVYDLFNGINYEVKPVKMCPKVDLPDLQLRL